MMAICVLFVLVQRIVWQHKTAGIEQRQVGRDVLSGQNHKVACCVWLRFFNFSHHFLLFLFAHNFPPIFVGYYFPQGPFPGDPSTLLRITYSDSRSHIIQSALRNCVVCFSNVYCSKQFAYLCTRTNGNRLCLRCTCGRKCHVERRQSLFCRFG